MSGFTVCAVADGKAVIDHLNSGLRPDVIVSDFRLDHETELDIVNAVRAILGTYLPAIFITGDTSAQQIEAANLPACTIMHKPAPPDSFGCSELTVGVGQITGDLIVGPLAIDNANSKSAAKTKGIVSDVAGDADILIAPDLAADNMIGTQLFDLTGADAAGLVLGARVPVISASRADGLLSRLA